MDLNHSWWKSKIFQLTSKSNQYLILWLCVLNMIQFHRFLISINTDYYAFDEYQHKQWYVFLYIYSSMCISTSVHLSINFLFVGKLIGRIFSVLSFAVMVEQPQTTASGVVGKHGAQVVMQSLTRNARRASSRRSRSWMPKSRSRKISSTTKSSEWPRIMSGSCLPRVF